MLNLYNTISSLCEERNISIGKMCSECEIRRSLLTDLKMGRTKTLSTATLTKIASYFNIPVDSLINGNINDVNQTTNNEETNHLSPAFFKLKKGLEPYNLDERDVDFLLSVYKAHIEKNK